MSHKIMLVEDDQPILEMMEILLSRIGYTPLIVPDVLEALEMVKKDPPALILLDVMMDGMDGFEFCKLLRENADYRDIPVIFLSAKTEEFDRVLGLELGGDDYIAKPFSLKEVGARVKAVLRRTDTKTRQILNEKKIAYKGVELFPEKYALKIDGKSVKLTKTEFEILFLFLKHPEKIFTRDNIIDSIRGDDVYVIDRTIDVHIMNRLKKLGKYKNIISTFSGVGYGFKE